MHYGTTTVHREDTNRLRFISKIRRLVCSIISSADKLGGGWERDIPGSTASGERYDDDGDGKYVGLRLLLLAAVTTAVRACLLYTSPSPRDGLLSRMPSSA